MKKLIFLTKSIEISVNLTVDDITNHANGFVRYNNIMDLARSGPWAIQWFLERIEKLYGSKLTLKYFTVFGKFTTEDDTKAFPIYDFISFVDGEGSQGFGVMFSSHMREYYRKDIEINGSPENPLDQRVFQMLFGPNSVLDIQGRPFIVMPRSSSQNGFSVTDQYLKNLKLLSEEIKPATSDFPFRCYFMDKEEFSVEQLKAFLAIGQSLFEIVRPNLYPLSDSNKPSFDLKLLGDVKWNQHKTALKWVDTHLV